MRLALVTPAGRGEPVSGGDRYNLELRRALERQGHVVSDGDAPIALVDGLDFRSWRPVEGQRQVGLIHVPAAVLDPDPAIVGLEQAFLNRLDGVQFVSEHVRRETQARYRLPEHTWVAEPGRNTSPCEAGRGRTHLKGAPGEGLTIAPRDSTPAPPPSEGALLLGIANLTPNKRVHEALQFFASLRELSGWRAEWLGSATVDPAYAATLSPPAQVLLRGATPHAEVLGALTRATALITFSGFESWGLAEAEALSHGVPVFAANPSGLSAYLGGEGYRHPAQLREHLRDASRLASLRAEAQRAATRLPTWDHCARITAAHLEALCARSDGAWVKQTPAVGHDL